MEKSEMLIEGGQTKLVLVDGMHAEDVAMLQALYSRSAASVTEHLGKVEKAGSGKFMESFYVNYNHKSIADCGDTTLFIEGVSMLTAKAIQDWPLYSGQETSSRYIDMANRRVVDPIGSPASKRVIERWMDFYRSYQESVAGTVRARHPRREGELEKDYEGAIKARTFDIMRGFLPAGTTTQLSWHTNLRQAADHMAGLRYHPLAEVRTVAAAMGMLLHERYPSSGFGSGGAAGVTGVSKEDPERRAAREAWEAGVARSCSYPGPLRSLFSSAAGLRFSSTVPREIGSWTMESGLSLWSILSSRPRGAILPPYLSALGQITMSFDLDFGSFRDIQRHRNGACPMPLLTREVGFEPWYLEQLGPGVEVVARRLVEEQAAEISKLDASSAELQNYYAMGFRVPVEVTYALPTTVYVLETRSAKVVHPTLRKVILQLARLFKEELPAVALHVDTDPDDWTVRRGRQTIVEKA